MEKHQVRLPDSICKEDVDFEEENDFFLNLFFSEAILVILSIADDILELVQVVSKGFFDILKLSLIILLGRNQIAHSFIKQQMEMLLVEFFCLFRYLSYDFLYVRFILVWLLGYKLIACRLADLQKCIACHIHNSLKLFLHKLEQFLNDSLKESPVVPQESRILPNHVHDTRRNDSLVVLALFGLTQLKQCP